MSNYRTVVETTRNGITTFYPQKKGFWFFWKPLCSLGKMTLEEAEEVIDADKHYEEQCRQMEVVETIIIINQ